MNNEMDAWYEEDEVVLVNARDTYYRVDVLESCRHVKDSVNGEVVSEMESPRTRLS